jgi:hypothetical protein
MYFVPLDPLVSINIASDSGQGKDGFLFLCIYLFLIFF